MQGKKNSAICGKIGGDMVVEVDVLPYAHGPFLSCGFQPTMIFFTLLIGFSSRIVNLYDPIELQKEDLSHLDVWSSRYMCSCGGTEKGGRLVRSSHHNVVLLTNDGQSHDFSSSTSCIWYLLW